MSLEEFVFASPESAFFQGQCAALDRAAIDGLRAAAGRSPRRHARLCIHADADAALHEMFIFHRAGAYVRPHLHLGKAESLHVVSGSASAVIFAADGGIAAIHPLGACDSGRRFFLRFDEGVFHTLLIESDEFIFHETTLGPFRREDTVFAPWAPSPEAPQACSRYVAELAGRIAAHRTEAPGK